MTKSDEIVFFHPNCLDNGGGEKVLWHAVHALAKTDYKIGIYSENCDLQKASEKVTPIFNIEIQKNLKFYNVGPASFLQPNKYKRLTLLRQALSSFLFSFRCLFVHAPSVIIDTTGSHFSTPIWKYIGGAKVILYVHYPFISTDMLSNAAGLKNSYYKFLSIVYSKAGHCADLIMVNSTWTSNNVKHIFKRTPQIVYPPCDIERFTQLPLENREKGLILSVCQFRPEKRIEMQLEIIEKVMTRVNCKLVIIGGCRNENDRRLFDNAQRIINEKSLPVELRRNVTFDELEKVLGKADVGLHTMHNEHFGICAVEYIAAGLIPLCNKSAGPLLDIVRDERFLALDTDEYVEKLIFALNQGNDVRQNFREQSMRFSNAEFGKQFIEGLDAVLN